MNTQSSTIKDVAVEHIAERLAQLPEEAIIKISYIIEGAKLATDAKREEGKKKAC